MIVAVVVAGAAVVVAVVLAVLLVVSRRAAAAAGGREAQAVARVGALEREAKQARADAASAAESSRVSEERVQIAEAEADAAREAAATAEGQLAEVEGRAKEAEDRATVAVRTAEVRQHLSSALWDLVELDQEITRRTEATLSTAPSDQTAFGLAGAVALDVARTREESGTPGRLQLTLDADLEPSESLLVLHALRALLTILARHCDAFRIEVHSGRGHLTAIVCCEGFDGGPPVVEDARNVAQVLDGAGVRATVTAGLDAALEARLVFPIAPAG